MEFREKVVYYLTEFNMDQKTLAQKSGMSTGRISEICTGKVSNPRLRTVVDIADALGVEVSELIEDVHFHE